MAIAADRISTKLFIQHPTAFDIKIVGILEQLAPGQSTHGRKIALVRAASTFNLNKRAYLSNISIFRFYMERWGQLYSQYLRQRDDVLSGHKLNQKVHFQAQRLSIPKTTCRSIAFRLVPVRFSVSLAVLFFFFFFFVSTSSQSRCWFITVSPQWQSWNRWYLEAGSARWRFGWPPGSRWLS